MSDSLDALKVKIRAKRLEIYELELEYMKRLYFETMPEYDPMYKYSYDVSNRSITPSLQSISAWLQAISEHMALRRPGHGGCYNIVKVFDIPVGMTDGQIDGWVEWCSVLLKKAAVKHKRRLKNEKIPL
jgi:hypothetical protein